MLKLEQWWQDVYEELFDEKKEELLDSGDYYKKKKINMKETQNTLPNWFEGTVYDEGDVITNPFSW